MLPLIQKEIIEIHGWFTGQEFIDMIAIAEMTPGPIAINSATFLGYKMGGVLGSIIATFAVTLPSFIVMLTIVHFFNKFKDSDYVQWAFKGIRPVVFGLIASAGISVAMDTYMDLKSIVISLGIFYFVSFKKMHPILSIAIAGILGVILY